MRYSFSLIASTVVFLLAVVSTAACTPGSSSAGGGGGEPLVVAEPAHNLGYLPFYIAIDKGIFAKNGLTVKYLTASGSGGAHVNAVLSGQAYGFIGGPEHNGFVLSKQGGDSTQIKSIANVVNRGNVYFVARSGVSAPSSVTDVKALAAFLKGKKVVTSAYGGTPNSILRYVLASGGLGANDIQLTEAADVNAILAAVQTARSDFAVISDPQLQQGIEGGIWQQPFVSIPQLLGDYAYSTINVPTKTYSTPNGKQTTTAFVKSISEALGLIQSDHQVATEVATKEFPNLSPAMIQAVLDRSYRDQLWAPNADISQKAVDTALSVVRTAAVLNDSGHPATYGDVVDMEFLK